MEDNKLTDKNRKRRRDDTSAMDLTVPKQSNSKRIKESIIDDDIASKVLRKLGCDEKFLNSGKLLAWALQPDDPAFIRIYDYVNHSQAYPNFGVKILSILRIIPNADHLGETQAPIDFKDDPQAREKLRKMLWHGTKRESVTSILENGLRLPKDNRDPWFGSGIYFSDRVAYSALYCNLDMTQLCSGQSHYLFLCDVLLGNVYETRHLLPYITAPPERALPAKYHQAPVKYQSVKALGRNVPDASWDMEIDGCVWSLGKTLKVGADKGPFPVQFNEYVVYNSNQVQPKYLLKVQCTQEPYFENVG